MRDTDRTIVQMPQSKPAAPAVLSQILAQQMPKSVLSRVELLLTEQIGPIAKVLVRKVSNSTTDTNQLIDKLAAEIGPEHREAFKIAVRQHLGQPGGAVFTGTAMLSPELLEALTKQLVPHIGPIAKILIKKAAKTSSSRAELCQTLSGHIDDDGPVAELCRPKYSFKPPFVRKPTGFSSLVLNVFGGGYRSR